MSQFELWRCEAFDPFSRGSGGVEMGTWVTVRSVVFDVAGVNNVATDKLYKRVHAHQSK